MACRHIVRESSSNQRQSARLHERMAQLSRRFADDLPKRIQELRSAVGAFKEVSDLEHCFAAQLQAHKLAGAAGSFGFQEISEVARQLEGLFIQPDNSEDSVPPVDMQRALELLEQIQHAAQKGSTEELEEVVDVQIEGSGAHTGLLIALLVSPTSDARVWDEIESQLGFFGFSVSRAGSISEIENLVRINSVTIVVSDIEMLQKEAERNVDFHRLDSGAHFVAAIAVAVDDSFETRLAAIRYGAQAFFTQPLDIPRLVDKIDELEQQGRPKPLHVLIVDDDVDQVSQIAFILQQAGMITSVASDPSQVFSLMVEAKPELVIMDMYMPDCNGIELSQLIRQQEAFVGIPIIFLSVEDDIERHMDAMSKGGDDFIVKPVNPDYLVAVVRIRAERTRQMRYFMERDSLTSLLNHSHLKQQLALDVTRAERMGCGLCFAMIDIDHFKNVNDQYGHLCGDRVLKSLSRLLTERLRKTDTIGRYGGEEFGIVLFNTDGIQAARLMDELRESFSRLAQRSGEEEFSVTFSCGLASYPDVPDAESLAELADRALYQAKQTGRNRVVSV